MPHLGSFRNTGSDGFPPQGAGDIGRQAESLVEVFDRRAAEHPDRIAFTFLPSGEEAVPEDRSYGALDRQARAIAARLQQICRPGDRVLLMYDAGLDYVAALAGCLYAGVLAVPVFPPDPLRVARVLPRLEAIVKDAQASVLLGTASDLAWAGAMLGQIDGLGQLVPSNTIDKELAEHWTAPRLNRNTPAFLQYTSGSTGTPKGVLIRHGNVLANMTQMEQMIDVENAVVCTWLPAYHDMGLVGGIFQCWYSGRRNVMLSPLAFFQQPLRWLRAVADFRATTIAAPDFAYDLCVRKIKPKDRRDLDLSSLRLALSGAEPVRAETIDRFVEAFGECGVKKEVFCPCYGMAEATLMVTASKPGTAPTVRSYDAEQLSRNVAVPVDGTGPRARTLVGCGQVAARERVVIVDCASREMLGSRQVGEIWIAGPNVATEYWGRQEASMATFQAFTTSGDGPFLRTGDLGFIDGEELFISGRAKDLIIIRGRNYHPQDIEQSIENCHDAVKPRGAAVFSIDTDGQERMVVVQEVARPNRVDLQEVSRSVRRAILSAHELTADAVVLVRSGALPKTTSGKLQRHACREQYLRGELDVLDAWQAPKRRPDGASYVAPRNEMEAMLAEVWSEVLGVERVGVFDSFLDLGGSSLLATQLISRLAPQIGEQIPLGDLFDRPTIAALADLIRHRAITREAADAGLIEYLNGLSDEVVESMLAGRNVGRAGTHSPAPSSSRATQTSYVALLADGNNGQETGPVRQ